MVKLDFRTVVEQVQKKIRKQVAPLKISIMGQTGVGKSSVLNALFRTDKLETDDVRPRTEKIERIRYKNREGDELWFYDLPGIGESIKRNAEVLSQYSTMFKESDIILWAIHADSRSFTFDIDALQKIFESIEKADQARLMSKITFVLTKVDLLTPPPWILSKFKEFALFVPQEETEKLLEEKEVYFQEVFLSPFKNELISQTFLLSDFSAEPAIPQIQYDKEAGMLYYEGLLDKDHLEKLIKNNPKYTEAFRRLYDNYRIIPCSSRYRFNLELLMRVIINKLGANAVNRFGSFFDGRPLNEVPLYEAKNYCNLIVFDEENKRLLFDLAESKFMEG